MTAGEVTLRNGGSLPLDSLPILPWDEFADTLLDEVAAGARVSAHFAATGGAGLELFSVLARDARRDLRLLRTTVAGDFPSLTPRCPQLHLFEREIAEQYGVVAEGHPWFKPVRFHRVWRPGCDAWGRSLDATPLPGDLSYYQVAGDEVHEVAVGPVHAGIIEPGHFRFQCHGETVMHLEIALGYQHRGIEPRLMGIAGRSAGARHQLEAAAGDTTIGHALAYAQLREALAGISAPPRAAVLRAVALELERLASHVGDIGGLATDIGFLPTASFCGRIRGEYLNLTAEICGNRFGRGLVCPGGCVVDLDAAIAARMSARLAAIEPDTRGAVKLFFATPSVLARLEGTGRVAPETARELGLVGVAARACGFAIDARSHHRPAGEFCGPDQVVIEPDGDVYARARVRQREIEISLDRIAQNLDTLPDGPVRQPLPPAAPSSLAVSMVEGWRGETVHVALTDEAGEFARYKIVDPSFRNWSGLAMAMRGEQISDFPLINKSFNLSYCGFDL